jgi:myosin-crossreactive antigen
MNPKHGDKNVIQKRNHSTHTPPTSWRDRKNWQFSKTETKKMMNLFRKKEEKKSDFEIEDENEEESSESTMFRFIFLLTSFR